MLRSAVLILALSQAIGAEPSSDFAVRIEYGGCGLESLDSVQAMFSRRIRAGVVRVAKLEFSAAQRQQLFDLVTGVDLFEYPPHFEPAITSVREMAQHYSIQIRLAGRQHVVQWVDHGSSDSSAVRLRDMLRSVQAWLLLFPSVKNLPRSEMICL